MPLPKILLAADPRLAWFPDMTPDRRRQAVAGWREWAALPEIGIARVAAKIDTGARTSALHANRIETFEENGAAFVRFDVSGEADTAPWHVARVTDRRLVRSSNGEAEARLVIGTQIEIAGKRWPIELTLTNRERMDLPMLIGREAIAGRLLVDAAKSWLWGRPVPPRRRKARPAATAPE